MKILVLNEALEKEIRLLQFMLLQKERETKMKLKLLIHTN